MKLTRLHAGLRQRLRNTGGYTIDQTILIVAIIAILVTMIIITVGWNLINKSSGTKLASQFRQVEDANGQFYSTYRIWPHQSHTAPNANSTMMALKGTMASTGKTFTTQYSNSPDAGRNFAPGFASNAAGTAVQHNFGSGGTISELGPIPNPFGLTGDFMVVQFQAVPFSEVQTAERAIDGDANVNYAAGRIVASTSACIGNTTTAAVPSGVDANTASSALVFACYAANVLQ